MRFGSPISVGRASGRLAGRPVPDFAVAARASDLGHLGAAGHPVGRPGLVGDCSFIASWGFLALTERPVDRCVPLIRCIFFQRPNTD